MKRLEINLNILHYCIYRTHYNLHLLAQRINPFNLIHKLPFQKKKYEQLGINIHDEINKAFGGNNTGMSVMVAGGFLFFVLFFMLFAITNILLIAFNVTALSAVYFIIFGLISFIVCYSFVFKENKYLKYFQEFEGWTKGEEKKYGWMSFLFILIVIMLFLAPLIFRI